MENNIIYSNVVFIKTIWYNIIQYDKFEIIRSNYPKSVKGCSEWLHLEIYSGRSISKLGWIVRTGISKSPLKWNSFYGESTQGQDARFGISIPSICTCCFFPNIEPVEIFILWGWICSKDLDKQLGRDNFTSTWYQMVLGE